MRVAERIEEKQALGLLKQRLAEEMGAEDKLGVYWGCQRVEFPAKRSVRINLL
jgi:hypothetical protein